MVPPRRKAEFEGETCAWKRTLLSLTKRRVSLSMKIVKERCIVRYRTEKRLLERLGTIPSEYTTDPSARQMGMRCGVI